MASKLIDDVGVLGAAAEAAEAQAEPDGAYSVRALSRGLSILRCFDVEHPEWGVAELSRHLGLNKATIYRLVKTLEAEGFLASDPVNGRYHVGSALLRIAHVGLARSELVRIARPHMERLASETGESVDLAVSTDEGVLFIAQVLTSRPFKPVSSVGRVFSDIANAHSKVFVASVGREKRDAILARPQAALTPYTITDPQRLAEEIRKVEAEGVAYDYQEHTLERCGVAAPIRDSMGRVRASLAVVAPVDRFGQTEVAKLAQCVKEASYAIARDLGYQ